MSNNGIVTIHGKDYMTVARRVELAHTEKALESVQTEVLSHNPVVVKAAVQIKGKLFTGISSVHPDSHKIIERQNPYEVAETSAVGRALGFAGYGVIESIASADEVIRATALQNGRQTKANFKQEQLTDGMSDRQTKTSEKEMTAVCEICGKPASERKGITKGGKPYHGIFCSTDEKSHTRWLWN